MKHKHAELIKAWADGAEIEARYEKSTGWTDWKTEDGGFVWYIGGAEYRIKPEPKPDVVRYLIGTVRVIYDGETGELKKAGLLNDTSQDT